MRFLLFLVGAFLLAIVVYLGYIAGSNPSFVIWFGLAAAILAPSGIACISYAFTYSSREALAKLEKIPEIQKLIEAANTQEEKIKLLEKEKEQLITAIEIETRKQAIISRKEQLENDASIILSELNSIVTELESLDVEIENSKAIEIISTLNERLESRRRGDVVITIGGRIITLNRDLILSLPMGRIILSYFQFINSIANKARKANKQKQADA